MENSLIQKEKEELAVVNTTRPYIGNLVNMRVDIASYKDQTKRNIEIVEHRGAVLIIPVISDKKIIFIKQYRKAVRKILLELPAGTIEKDETPLSCAQKELQEEAGYFPNKLLHLCKFYPSPGFCTEIIHVFIATELQKSKLPQDDDEGIDVVELSLTEALQKIDNNEIIDAKTIVSIFKYIRQKKIEITL